MNDQELAKQIVKHVGGKENISQVRHCATRLRLIVRNKDLIETDQVENLDDVKGSFFNSGQYQIILGTGLVNRVYDETLKIVGEDNNENAEEVVYGNKFQRAIRMFSDVFVPIIPVLVATGLFMGLRGLRTQETILKLFGLTTKSIPSNLLLFTQILTDTAFAFLPALVCWSTFKNFGGSPVIGIVLGLMLVNPALPSAYDVGSGAAKPLMFFGFLKVSGYQGSVLPAFVTGIVGAHFEKWLRHHIPDAIDLIITPFLTLLVSIILALFGIGPLLHAVETFVLWLVENILFLPMGIGGFLYGCFGQLLGIFGIHHILNFLEISMLAKDGWNYLNPIGTCGNVAQAGAVLAVAIKIKNNKTKQVAYPSALSALLGITEPAVFGVNLRLVKPFIAAMIGGGVGGFFASIFHLKATGMSITGIPGTLLYLNSQLPIYILVNVIAFAVAFAITWFFGVKNEEEKEAEAPAPVIENESEALYAIADGEAIVAADIEDPTFADGLLGPCFGIRPTNGNVYAPADGVITLTVPTKHAIGITTSNGAEILLHLGLDTVKMEGKCFQDQLQVGAHVKKGDLLTTMDLDMVKKAGYSITMITIVTNGQNYDDIHQIKTGEIKAGDEVMALKK
ncbi:MAG: glucose PTS transporter subunit IIA [Intestinibaculum porci]|uniref:PTS beta-glucoside transporter subunit IIBCA n=1 Tax=Intestinibaculum porci TaxID=2487118 RepID=UPI003F0E004F